jgi:transcriptional regulator with XRE-family HTH domain
MALKIPKEAWKKALGASIRGYRIKSGFTQAEASRHYGCSLRWWQHLETGKNISIKTLLLVAKVLVVKPWLLLRW